jgi:drug/metabolite transporter (DMT)-like permease
VTSQPSARTPSPLAIWAGIAVLYLVWGSTYLAIRVAVATIPAILMGGMRFTPAGVILTVAMAASLRGRLVRPSWIQVRDASIVGFCLIGGGMGLVAWSEQTVSSGIAALLVALMPMWVGVLSRIAYGARMPRRAVAGTIIGLGGVALLAGPSIAGGGRDVPGLLALLVSPVCWATGSLYAARRAVQPKPALLATGVQMLAGGTLLLVVAAVTGQVAAFNPAAVAPQGWLALGYLIGVGSLIGYVTFAWLVGVAPLAHVTTYAYVNPVVAVALGALILGEPLELRTLAAAAVIVLGVMLIVSAGGRAASPAREAVVVPE